MMSKFILFFKYNHNYSLFPVILIAITLPFITINGELFKGNIYDNIVDSYDLFILLVYILLAAGSIFILVVNTRKFLKTNNDIKVIDLNIDNNLRNYQMYYDKGKLLFELGDYSSAIDQFSKVIELNPSYPEAYKLRAESYINTDDHFYFKNALNDLQIVEKLIKKE